jgi:hypothetical protein
VQASDCWQYVEIATCELKPNSMELPAGVQLHTYCGCADARHRISQSIPTEAPPPAQRCPHHQSNCCAPLTAGWAGTPLTPKWSLLCAAAADGTTATATAAAPPPPPLLATLKVQTVACLLTEDTKQLHEQPTALSRGVANGSPLVVEQGSQCNVWLHSLNSASSLTLEVSIVSPSATCVCARIQPMIQPTAAPALG